jgi:hypothetical protein
MKRITAFFIVLFAAAAMAATEPDKDNGQAEPEEKAQSAPVTGADSREELLRSGSWPRPFVPSEKIGADSVVSFPADI